MRGTTDLARDARSSRAPAPILKWVGGKRQLVPEILKAFGGRRLDHYFEPFVGGGAVFFALVERDLVCRAVLSDTNAELITTYRAVQREVDRVIAILAEHRNTRDHYYAVRDRDPAALSPAERAARMLYLNRTCFNGLYRVNARGQFNVSFGRYVNPTICDADGLRAAARALARAELRICDYSVALDDVRAGDHAYCDPPYVPLSPTASFTQYTPDGFSALDHMKLRDFARLLKGRRASVVLSNSDTPIVRELYCLGFSLREVKAARAVNCRADRRGAVSELLIT